MELCTEDTQNSGASDHGEPGAETSLKRQRQQQHQGEGLRSLVDAAAGQLGSMGPISIAQMAWAGSQLDPQRPPGAESLATAASSAALTQLHLFGAQELATLVHSLARRGGEDLSRGRQGEDSGGAGGAMFSDWMLFQAAGDAALPLLKRGAFTPSGLANLAWAFARHGQPHPELALAVSTAAIPRISEFGPQELANLLWGLYQLGRRDKALLDRVAAHVGSGVLVLRPSSETNQRSVHCRTTGMAAAVITWCFARCGYYSPGLYDKLADAALPHLPCIPPYNLAQLLWAFSAHGHRNQR